MNPQKMSVSAALVTRSNVAIPLAPLLSWEILRTDGESLDAITVRTLHLEQAELLAQADCIVADCAGKRVFTGLVDEIELGASDAGTVCSVYGRGNGARLADNQVRMNRYERLTTEELLRSYVAPFGLCAVQSEPAALEQAEIRRGMTALAVVQGFCAHAGLLPPMFDENGCLLLRRTRPESGLYLRREDVSEAVYRDTRYGVRSFVELRHTKTGKREQASYGAFLRRGGRSERYGSFAGEGLRLDWRSAKLLLEEARREEYTLTLCLPGDLDCAPGSVLTAVLPQFGVKGRFSVHSVLRSGSPRGCTTRLHLRRE